MEIKNKNAVETINQAFQMLLVLYLVLLLVRGAARTLALTRLGKEIKGKINN